MYKIYLISANHPEATYYKIGWTKRDPIKRLKELKTANSQELQLVQIFESKWGPRIESNLHRYYSEFRCEGEWFKLDTQQVKKFKETCQKQEDMLELLIKENSWVQESKKFSKYL